MQIDLFDVLYDDFKFTEPLKTITLFSGIGFQEMGMDLAEIPYKMIGTSEIDKFAILSYAAIHTDYLKIRDTYDFPDKEIMVKHLQDRNIGINLKTHKQTITNSTNIETVKDYYLASVLNKNLGDISKVKGADMPKDIDLLTYSFPCTDLSKAGQQAGLSCGTRSGLVYEVLRILYELKEQDNLPKVLIMENVIDLIQVKFVDEWNKIALEIEQMGYTNFTQVLNGKDYGVAQNRRRVFMVSVLGDYNYNFPQPTELKYRLKDYLEKDVDESYYLSDKDLGWAFGNALNKNLKDVYNREKAILNKDIAYTVSTKQERRVGDSNFVADNVEGEITVKDFIDQAGIETIERVAVPEATKQGYALAKDGDGVYINRPHQKRGVVQDGMIQTIKTGANDVGVVVDANDDNRVINPLKGKTNKGWHFEQAVYDDKGVTRALKAGGGSGNIPKVVVDKPNLRIRKLTPTETGRLMGMQDYQIARQEKVSSNAQMYKQHGNGIIAQVMAFIIGMMWYEDEKKLKDIVSKNSHTWINKKPKRQAHTDNTHDIEPKTLNPKVNGKQPSLQDRVYDSDYISVAVTPGFHPSYKVTSNNTKGDKQ